MKSAWMFFIFAILVLSISFPLNNAWAITEDAKLTASDPGTFDQFGVRASISGTTAIVGASADDDGFSNSGSAYIFDFDGTNWSQTAKLTASDAAENDFFGSSVSISGTTAIIGASSAGNFAGAAYIFDFDGTNWTQTAKLTASDAAEGDIFGESVFISGTTAIISATFDDGGGSAYIFDFDGTDWTQTAKLTASDAAADDNFGRSVGLSGTTAIVGAPDNDDAGSRSGSAYIFDFDGTNWTQTAKLTASDAAENDFFGHFVSISGTTAILGAHADDDAGSLSGSAYIFDFDGTNWTQTAKLTASDAAADDRFGQPVSISGTTAIIGAHQDDDSGSASGSAYIFDFDGTNWTQTAKLTASDAAPGDQFGISVYISGTTAIVGAFLDDVGVSNSGSAYIFEGIAPSTPTISINNQSVNEGDSGDFPVMTFDVALVETSDLTITVDYATADGTANAGSDYTATLGQLTFNPGDTLEQIFVTVLGDDVTEADETFEVNLSNPTNAEISQGTGQGTIIDDDEPTPIEKLLNEMVTFLQTITVQVLQPITPAPLIDSITFNQNISSDTLQPKSQLTNQSISFNQNITVEKTVGQSDIGYFSWLTQSSGHDFRGIEVDATGIFVGKSTQSNSFLTKHSLAGDELWSREAQTDRLEFNSRIALDSSGVYLAGNTEGALPNQVNFGGNDIFIIKFDTNGNIIWSKQIGTETDEYLGEISAENSSIYLLSKTKEGFQFSNTPLVLTKLDINGNQIWTKQFGASSADSGLDLFVFNNEIYVLGETNGSFPDNSNFGGKDVFVGKFDDNGNQIWTKQIGTSSGESGGGLFVDETGIYLSINTGGSFPETPSFGQSDGYVIKLNLEGNQLWVRPIGSPGIDSISDIMGDDSGIFFMGNSFGEFPSQKRYGGSDLFSGKLSKGGEVIWLKQFGTKGNDNPGTLSVFSSEVFLGGSTPETFFGQTQSSSYRDIFVAKMFEINELDNIPPSLVLDNLTKECDEPLGFSFEGVGASDNLDGVLFYEFTEEKIEGANSNEFLINRSWEVFDSSVNSASGIQTITVDDTTSPTMIAPDDITLISVDGNSISDVFLGRPTIRDNCDGSPGFFNSAPNSFPLGQTTVLWAAADESGNSATDTQKVTVVPTVFSAFTEKPPTIDGKLSYGEWNLQNRIPFEHGFYKFAHDDLRLYILVDILDDDIEDNGDIFWLTFDKDQDFEIDPRTDLRYRFEPGTDNMRYQQYRDGGLFTPFFPITFSSKAMTYDCWIADDSLEIFPRSCDKHRVMEFAIDLAEIGAKPGGSTNFGMRLVSSFPPIFFETNTGFNSDFSKLIKIDLAASPNPLPASTKTTLQLLYDDPEVTQAIQTVDNQLPLVENKKTVARVYGEVTNLPSDKRTEKGKVFLFGQKDGQDLPGSPLGKIDNINKSPIDRENIGHTTNFVLPDTWTSDTITLQTRMLDLNGNRVTGTSSSYPFNPTNDPLVWVIPTNFGTETNPELPKLSELWKRINFLEATYPISEMRLELKPHTEIGPTGFETIFFIETGTLEGLKEYEESTILAYHAGIASTGKPPFEFPRQIAAFTPKGGGDSGGKADVIWLGGAGRSFWAADDESRISVFAHEMNHNLDRSFDGTWGRHVSNPDNLDQKNFGCGAAGPDPNWPSQTNNGYIRELGMDTRNNDLQIISDTTFDLMSYCSPPWASPYRWVNLLEVFNSEPIVTPSFSSRINSLSIDNSNFLYISGYVDEDGTGNLSPIFIQPGMSSPNLKEGSFSIEILDSQGNNINSKSFEKQFLDVEGNLVPREHFSFRLEKTSDDITSVLLKNGDTVLDEITKSEHPPELTITEPNQGSIWSQIQTISWDAFDEDGDELSFSIIYSPDNGSSWFPIAHGISGIDHTFDTSGLPGGSEAKIRVIASDGLNNTIEESELFVVPSKAPQAFIIFPENNSEIPSGSTIVLEGLAVDTEDQDDLEDSFVWSLDGQIISFGNLQEAIISDGNHVLTLEVTDSDGNQATTSIEFNLIEILDSQTQIQQLIDTIEASNLEKGTKNSLTGPLKQTQKLLEDSNEKNDGSVCNKLDAFVNEAEAQTQKKLDSNFSSSLIVSAQNIQENFEC